MDTQLLRLSLKYVLVICFTLTIVLKANAQTKGNGCLLNGKIYRKYLGQASPYGWTYMRYYKTTGASVSINYNNWSSTKPNNYNYVCGMVNSFPASYVGPAQQEFSDRGADCIVSTRVGGSIDGYGRYVSYDYNDPYYCSPVNVPVDDYLWVITLIIGSMGAYFISKKSQLT